jgi:hypothetical protein
MNEKESTIATLEALHNGIRDLANQIGTIESFLVTHFRQYPGSHINPVWSQLTMAQAHIGTLKQLTSTNRENAHRLELDHTVGMDENGNYRRSNVPPSHPTTSILRTNL